MARYIPQHLFDGLVVKYLLCETADTPDAFDKIIDQYLEKYPDERSTGLVADIVAAANEGRYAIKVLMDAPNSKFPTPVDALEGLMDVFTKAIELEKPFWRRVLEDYFLNVQTTPIPDRVMRAKEHLVAAEKVLQQRMAAAALAQ